MLGAGRWEQFIAEKEPKLLPLTPLEGRAAWLRRVPGSAGSQLIQLVHLLCERKKGRNT